MKKQPHNKKHTRPVFRALKRLSLALLLATLFALVTERAQLPQPVRDNAVIIALYDTAGALKKPFGATPAEIEPAAGTDAGYKPGDRARLDALILEGEKE